MVRGIQFWLRGAWVCPPGTPPKPGSYSGRHVGKATVGFFYSVDDGDSGVFCKCLSGIEKDFLARLVLEYGQGRDVLGPCERRTQEQ